MATPKDFLPGILGMDLSNPWHRAGKSELSPDDYRLFRHAMENANPSTGTYAKAKPLSVAAKLRARLGLHDGEVHGFQYLHVQEVGDLVHTFVVNNNKALAFTDDAVLYPNDALMGKLALLR